MNSEVFTHLTEACSLSEEQWVFALKTQMRVMKPLHEVLMDLGFLKEETFLTFASNNLKIPVIDLEKQVLNQDVFQQFPFKIAKQFIVFPIRSKETHIVLATYQPYDLEKKRRLEKLTGLALTYVLSSRSQIEKALVKASSFVKKSKTPKPALQSR